jgi:uncharacterized protein YqgC (DUF456 family)
MALQMPPPGHCLAHLPGTLRIGVRFILCRRFFTELVKETAMKSFVTIAVASVLVFGAATVAAKADCNRDTGSETVLGAGAGAAVGGLASHSLVGAAIGGVAGGLIGNSIGQADNRRDCRAEAQEYYREREEAYNDRYIEGQRDGYIGRDDYDHDYPDDD